MKTSIFITLCLLQFGLASVVFSQEPGSNPESWKWLLGKWNGQGSGQPGQGSGSFTFRYELDKHVIVRKSYSDYPATQDRPAISHEDLMVIYPDSTGAFTSAMYWDNEGHTIHYLVTYAGDNIVFTSKSSVAGPQYRLTYSPEGKKSVNVKFETSRDGVNWMTYVEGKSDFVE